MITADCSASKLRIGVKDYKDLMIIIINFCHFDRCRWSKIKQWSFSCPRFQSGFEIFVEVHYSSNEDRGVSKSRTNDR